MSEWQDITLGELTTKIGSGATPRGGSNSYKDEGISLIRSQNVLDLQFTTDGLAFIDDEQADGLKNVIVEEKDVLLNITGDSVARVCMVPNFILPARVNQHVSIIRADTKKAVPEYLLYNLISQKEELLMQSEIGATRKAITKGMIEQFELKIPPLEEQRTIASVLSSLDDKIDLLHRQNQTLEQMAETLFRQWFVPARAGEPHAGGEEADDGWEEKPLSEYFQLLGGFAFKSKDYLELGKYKVITIKGVQDGYLDSNSAARLDALPEKIKPYQILNTGDILMSLTGNVGRVCLVDEEDCLLNQRVAKIEPINRKWKAFAYFYFRQNEMIDRLTYLSKGSAQLNLSPVETLAQTEHFPDDSIIDSYCEVVNPFLSKIMTNKTQIRILTALRDTLLPKLMSGEVRIKI